MKPALWILPSCALALMLTSCGNSGSSNNPDAVTGPFDSNGNYREDWADNPSKWRKSSGSPSPHELRTDELPEIAGNTDQPPSNSVPLVSPSRSSSASSSPSGTTTRVISQTRVSEKPKSVTKVVSAPKPKAKPKPKPAPVKVKPKSVRYTVKKGDSLSSIASRTGSSVSAIRSANGISGTLIRPGQTLTIPKK
ncbi:MAG: LysM peptidoglycan-binding domain-containing protein [Verrucomicrobiota bacterium]